MYQAQYRGLRLEGYQYKRSKWFGTKRGTIGIYNPNLHILRISNPNLHTLRSIILEMFWTKSRNALF